MSQRTNKHTLLRCIADATFAFELCILGCFLRFEYCISDCRRWDAEKARKVLYGRVVVRVVNVDPSPELGDMAQCLGDGDITPAANQAETRATNSVSASPRKKQENGHW
jgi:hypothetical protein